MRPTERSVPEQKTRLQICVTRNSLTDGIALWELQEQKCRLRRKTITIVVQLIRAGLKALILKWAMVRFPGRFALIVHLTNARRQNWFQWKTVDRTMSTNFLKHHHVLTATVAQTECKTKDYINWLLVLILQGFRVVTMIINTFVTLLGLYTT